MKLRANQDMEYAHRSLKAGDVFDAESEIDAKLLTSAPPGALNVQSMASFVEDRDAKEKNFDETQSAGRRDFVTEETRRTQTRNAQASGKEADSENDEETGDKPDTKKKTRGRPRSNYKITATSRRSYGRRDLEAEKHDVESNE